MIQRTCFMSGKNHMKEPQTPYRRNLDMEYALLDSCGDADVRAWAEDGPPEGLFVRPPTPAPSR